MKTKHSLLAIAAGLMLCFYGCKKDSASFDPNSILGKWNIVSDSAFVGVGLNNHQEVYSGHAGDYFNFVAGGTLYTKEGAVSNTLSYTAVGDTGMVVSSFGLIANGVPATSHVTLTTHTLIIASPVALTPGGEFGRTVHLSR
jgi:hypothetical protein